jgi:microcephalin
VWLEAAFGAVASPAKLAAQDSPARSSTPPRRARLPAPLPAEPWLAPPSGEQGSDDVAAQPPPWIAAAEAGDTPARRGAKRARPKEEKGEDAATEGPESPTKRVAPQRVRSLLFSACREATLDVLRAAMRELGGACEARDEAVASHVVVERPTRTLKVLFALARGAWVVTSEWVARSREAGRWLPEAEFEVAAFAGAAAARRHREAGGRGLLRDVVVHVSRELTGARGESPFPAAAVLERLVRAAGGSVARSFTQARVCLAPELSARDYWSAGNEPRVQWPRPLKPLVLSPRWLLDSLAAFELRDPDAYRIEQERACRLEDGSELERAPSGTF